MTVMEDVSVPAPMMEGQRPWSDKYRPQTLDEVAAHKDIIDTSTW